MKRLSFLVVTLMTLGACGGPQQEDAIKPMTATSGAGGAPARSASGDVAFEVPQVELHGVVYEPEALGRPGTPLVDAKKQTTLEKQRSLVQTTKDPVAKQAQAAILATMLYREAKAGKDKDREKEKDKDKAAAQERALLTEARQALRDVAQQVGDANIDELTLRLLGSYELLLDDYPAAEKAWAALIAKDPKAKDVTDHRAWLTYAQLKQFKNAEAAATVGSERPDDKHPELAYVAAWARLRTGDGAGAWQAICTAARGWGQNAYRDVLEHELLWIAGRAGIPVDQVAAFIAGPLGKTKQQQYDMLARLGLTSYFLAGRWADAVAALDRLIAVGGDTVPANDRPAIRLAQAEDTVRLDAPDVAARFGKQAIESLAQCGAKCDKEKADTVNRVYLTGQLFHGLYATANDARYYQPAHDLYDVTAPLLDAKSAAEAKTNIKKLETTLRNLKAGTGTHDKGLITVLLRRRDVDIQACYEAQLGSTPKLGGTLVVNLEADASGAVKGVATEPKAGAADLSAVAGCAAARVKQWKLPKRGMPGTTRIKLTYTFAVKA